jgi:hypothetical protein
VLAWIGFVVGIFWMIYEAISVFRPGEPLLVLSPRGIFIRIPMVKTVHIPWHEVRGVDSLNFPARSNFDRRIDGIMLYNVTVVFVTPRFYDRFIHVDSFFLRGPYWENSFRPHGDQIMVAFHHDALPVEAQVLREAIDSRWRAFRNAKPTTAVPGLGPPQTA